MKKIIVFAFVLMMVGFISACDKKKKTETNTTTAAITTNNTTVTTGANTNVSSTTKAPTTVTTTAVQKFSLNASSDSNGSIIGNENGDYAMGTNVQIKAVPKDETYEFLGWFDDTVLVSEEEEYSFAITKNVTLEARYEDLYPNYVRVSTPEQFLSMNSSEETPNNYVIINDLDFTDVEIIPIDDFYYQDSIIDGLNHKISNCSINSATSIDNGDVYSLFIDFSGTLKNIYFDDFNIDATLANDENIHYLGLITNLNNDINSVTIENCHIGGSIDGTSLGNTSASVYAGGFCSISNYVSTTVYITINDSSSDIEMSISGVVAQVVASQFIAETNGITKLSNCIAYGDINVENALSAYIGSFAGYCGYWCRRLNIDKCISYSNITSVNNEVVMCGLLLGFVDYYVIETSTNNTDAGEVITDFSVVYGSMVIEGADYGRANFDMNICDINDDDDIFPLDIKSEFECKSNIDEKTLLYQHSSILNGGNVLSASDLDVSNVITNDSSYVEFFISDFDCTDLTNGKVISPKEIIKNKDLKKVTINCEDETKNVYWSGEKIYLSYIGDSEYNCSIVDTTTNETILINEGDYITIGNENSYEYILEEKIYNITVSKTDGGTAVENSNKITGKYNDTISVTATPSANYLFVGWEYDGGIISNETTASFLISEILIDDENAGVKAVFTQYIFKAIEGQNGSITGEKESQGLLPYNISVTAVPLDGYKLLGWYKNNTLYSTDLKLEETIMESQIFEVEAKFELITYNYSVAKEDNNIPGIIKVNGTSNYTGKILYEETITLSAIGENGYIFSGWYDGDNLVSSSANYQIIGSSLSADVNLIAKFEIKTVNYTIDGTDCKYSTYYVSILGNSSDSGIISGSFLSDKIVIIDLCVQEAYNPNATFLGWYDENDVLFSNRRHLEFYATGDINLRAKFASEKTITDINTLDDLKNIKNNLSGCYRLMQNIDLGTAEWEPIGTYENPFNGIFDGNGYVIGNGKITSDVQYAGLFGYSHGIIKNVGIENFVINISSTKEEVYVGTIVGYQAGSGITQSYANCDITVTGKDVIVGGLVGYYVSKTNSETTYNCIRDCYTTGSIDVNFTGVNANVGGIAGYITCFTVITYGYANTAIKVQYDNTIEEKRQIYVGMGYGRAVSLQVGSNWYSPAITCMYFAGSIDVNIADQNCTINRNSSISSTFLYCFGNISSAGSLYRSSDSAIKVNNVTKINGEADYITKIQTTFNTAFYEDTLMLSNTIWDLSLVSSTIYPTLLCFQK